MSKTRVKFIRLAELKKKFEFLGRFKKNLAAVKLDGQWFHINRDGKPAYGTRFAWVGRFNDSGTFAEAVDGDGNIFLINRRGERLARKHYGNGKNTRRIA